MFCMTNIFRSRKPIRGKWDSSQPAIKTFYIPISPTSAYELELVSFADTWYRYWVKSQAVIDRIRELQENERDLLAQDVNSNIGTTEHATQTEAEFLANPPELQALQESLIIAVNERDLVVEENKKLERRLGFVTENYKAYVEELKREKDQAMEQIQRIEEEKARLEEVIQQMQLENEIRQTWSSLDQ